MICGYLLTFIITITCLFAEYAVTVDAFKFKTMTMAHSYSLHRPLSSTSSSISKLQPLQSLCSPMVHLHHDRSQLSIFGWNQLLPICMTSREGDSEEDFMNAATSNPTNVTVSEALASTIAPSIVIHNNQDKVNTDSTGSLFFRFRETLRKGRSINKEGLAKLGLNVLLSYGFVSNFSYISLLIASWVTHGKRTGMSPLEPGQWKLFLAIYAGFFAINNIIRPIRFSLSLLLAPAFEKLVDRVQVKFRTKRATATGIVVFLVNVCGTLSYLFGGLVLATSIFKVKLLP